MPLWVWWAVQRLLRHNTGVAPIKPDTWRWWVNELGCDVPPGRPKRRRSPANSLSRPRSVDRSRLRALSCQVERLRSASRQARRSGRPCASTRCATTARLPSGLTTFGRARAAALHPPRAEAAQDTGEAKDALAQMGIALRDQSGKLRRSEDLLADVADAFARIEDPAKRARLAFKLFDSEGVALVNLLRGGSDAPDEMRERARDLGIVLDEDLCVMPSGPGPCWTRFPR
jgi:hypothetical protein